MCAARMVYTRGEIRGDGAIEVGAADAGIEIVAGKEIQYPDSAIGTILIPVFVAI